MESTACRQCGSSGFPVLFLPRPLRPQLEAHARLRPDSPPRRAMACLARRPLVTLRELREVAEFIWSLPVDIRAMRLLSERPAARGDAAGNTTSAVGQRSEGAGGSNQPSIGTAPHEWHGIDRRRGSAISGIRVTGACRSGSSQGLP